MTGDCIFCRIARGEAPASLVAETPLALAFMDINQPTDGHVLIIPKAHVQDIYGMDPRPRTPSSGSRWTSPRR